MQPIHYCAQFGHSEIFSMLCDQYGVNPMSAKFVSFIYVRYSAKKVAIVLRQACEPSHNSLCRQFSMQFTSTQTFVEVHEAMHS